MNTRFLASLCAIADTGSLAAAARARQLTSATITEQIQALEREFGVKLVRRQGRSIALTDEGRAIVGASREILSRVADLAQIAQLGRLRGILRIGSISTALISMVPPALKGMASRYPEISMNIVPGTSSLLFRMLEDGDIDCAITVEPRFTLAKGFGWHPVRQERLALVTPADLDHRTLGEWFAREPMIRMDRRSATGQIVTGFLKDKNLTPTELFELDAPDTITILVSQGLGISLLPDYGFHTSETRPISKVIIDDPAYSRKVGILYRQGVRDALVEALVAALSASLAERGSGRTAMVWSSDRLDEFAKSATIRS